MNNWRPLVYLSAPIMTGTHGNEALIEINVEAAMNMGYSMMNKGIVPYIPHLDWYWRKYNQRVGIPFFTEDQMLELDFDVILRCDAVLRVLGPSRGGDLEVAFARDHGKPVFFHFEDLLRAYGR